jgi:NAD(P)-dependent dehydrogenase (short-subunit alcohol dehydrogenase family)
MTEMRDINKMFRLGNRQAIITGGAGMLGFEFAKTLSAAGANVILVDVKHTCLEKASQLRKEHNTKAMGIVTDITNEKSVQNMVHQVLREFNTIDILINNAASQPEGFSDPIEKYSLQVWNKVFSVNITGMFICAKIIGRQMIKQRKGVIVNVSSIYGLVSPDPKIYENWEYESPISYSTTKSAVLNFTRHLATFWAKKGIRVNALTPGGVFTGQNSDFIGKYCERTSLGRMARKDDFNGAILFLASDASAYMTGNNLIVDGGWTAK